MSAVEDDFERALWNNQFYSSPAVLTESSSSNHLSNLKKQVNIPNSASTQSLSDHLGTSNVGSLGAEKSDKSGDFQSISKSNKQGNRTSLMKVSPSMKALEKELNSETIVPKMPAVITEEDEEEILAENGVGNGSKITEISQGYNSYPEYETEDVLDSKNPYGIQVNHPGAFHSAYSLSTFHTAKSTDTFLHENEEFQGLGVTRHASVATVKGPKEYVADGDTSPKLLPSSLAASLQSSENNETEENEDDESDDGTESEHVIENVFENKGITMRRPLESPQMKTMVSSSSCPALSDKNRFAPSTPRDKELESGDKKENLQKSTNSHDPKKGLTVNAKPPTLKDNVGPPKVQKPVRSLLDSPFKEEPETKSKQPAPPRLNSKQPAGSSPITTKSQDHKQASSAFGTPRSSARNSPRKSKSDAGVPKSPSFFFTHKKAATVDVSEESHSSGGGLSSKQSSKQGQAQPKPPNNKRFSFRGLFKIKSKNHSLNKLRDVDEDVEKPSVPVKLSAKSVSTPNMSALVREDKSDRISEKSGSKPEPRRHFFKRRGSSSTLSNMEAVEAFGSENKVEKSEKSEKNEEALETDFDDLDDFPQSKAETESQATMSKPATPVIAPTRDNLEIFQKAPAFPKGDTIREVDDSDYSPNITRDSPSPHIPGNGHENSENGGNDETDKEADLDDFSPYIPHDFLPSEANSSPLFGSPFNIDFSTGRPEIVPPRSQINLQYQPPQSPNKSMNSRTSNEQLAGETLFPKSLDAQEVESIVSLERSRSMRSIKSTKRSSFMNYNGSDENIVLGKNLGSLAATGTLQGTMRRSGSILKNSPSAQSLKPETYPSIEKQIAEAPEQKYSGDILAELGPVRQVRSPTPDEDYADFIEFSDYINFDNLDFSASPEQNEVYYADQIPSFLSPSPGIYVEDDTGNKSSVLESSEIENSILNVSEAPYQYENSETFSERPLEASELASIPESVSAAETSTAIDTTGSYTQPEIPEVPKIAENFQKHYAKGPQDFPPRSQSLGAQNPEIVFVPSQPSSDFETSRIVSEDTNGDISQDSFEVPGNASPMENTFKFAIDDNNEKNGPAVRPVSMSFKGFHGSAFKDRVLPSSGSHQSIQFDEESANEESVGQGFGSSEEESEDESGSFETHEPDTHFHSVSSRQRESAPEPKKMNSFDRRQQHIKNVLDLQPPSASLPFHHNRIPSISDQSSISSPKSLTSFISRMRKSPMSSPKIPPPRTTVKFSSRIILYDTYHHDEYDRHPEIATCNQLTPLLAQQIKQELNELKANMEVHEDSACYTQFF